MYWLASCVWDRGWLSRCRVKQHAGWVAVMVWRSTASHRPCPHCGKLVHRNSLSEHVRDRHLPAVAVHCVFCSKMFRTRNSLKVHMSVYHRGWKYN
ncbi:hypothetical protein PR048_032485 [Dryococelus australis]|uniref:C2H2-type domain-containing protein n=1 Tax=Dryococelus australis TaxID=614101 RepID=A0ABQ9G2C0_9NEOP|nr:hypothetical protein PR048_032485 [Dryococelus australis]